MLVSSLFWKSLAWGSIGAFLGIVSIVLYMALTTTYRASDAVRNRKMVHAGICVCTLSVAILVLLYPINHLYEYGLIAFGISGGAFYLAGFQLMSFLMKPWPETHRSDMIFTWLAYTIPPLLTGLAIGLCNYYWMHLT